MYVFLYKKKFYCVYSCTSVKVMESPGIASKVREKSWNFGKKPWKKWKKVLKSPGIRISFFGGNHALYATEIHNTLQLRVLFFFSIFCQPCPGLQNFKSVFQILKITQYGRPRKFSLFQGIHGRTGLRIDISISIRSRLIKFGKQVRQMRLIKQGAGGIIT